MLALLYCLLLQPQPQKDAQVLSYLLKAQYALVRDEEKLANDYVDQALQLDPDNADAAFLRLEIRWLKMRRTPIQLAEQRQLFLDDLEKRLTQFPKDYRFHKMMGQLLVENRWAREAHPQTPDFYLDEAMALMADNTLVSNEERADVYFDIGRWFYNDDQPYKATLAFSQIEDLDPDNVRALEALAKSAQNAHMLRLALRSYKKYSKRSTYDFQDKATPVSNAIHMLEFLLEPTPERLQELLDFLEVSRQSSGLLLRLAERMMFMGQETDLPLLLEAVPESLHGRRFYQLLFLGYMSRGDFDKVIEIAETRSKLYTNETLVTILEHAMEAALISGAYESCLAYAETYPQVSRFSARFQLYAAFAEVLSNGNDHLWNEMAKQRGPQDGMVAFVENALQTMSLEDFAIRNKVQLLRQFGAYDDALAFLSRRYPDGVPADMREEVAITHILAEDFEQAFPIYEALIAAHPDRADYHNNYGYFLADANRELEKAKTLIARAIELQPDTPAYLDSYGWVHYRLGDLKTAEHYIREALRHDPENSEKLDHLGDIYRRLGKEDVAREYWSEAMNQGGDRYFEIMKKLDP